MPEIDADLFQILTLVLLAVTLAVALAALSAVGKLRKELHSRTAHASLASNATPAAAGEVASDEANSSVTPLYQVHEEPEPEPEPGAALEAEETLESGSTEVAEDPFAQGTGEADPSLDPDPVLEEASSGFGSAESQAAWGLGAEGGSLDAAEEDIATAEPQEQQQAQQDDQPFEHEGRWYFRRGVELLVYEEATGQWVTAPDDVALASAPPLTTAGTSGAQTSQTPAQTFRDIAEAGAVSSEAGAGSSEAAAPEEEAGQFWKCPSCGAVNGSTADSCRMCFASKP